MKNEKPPKTHLICPNEKCKASNSPSASNCLLCKTSLEDAESILVADDTGYIPNYMSGSGFLFFIFGISYFKDSWLTTLFFMAGIILMAPIVLRKISQKLGRKHPNIFIRTALATIIFFVGLVISPSEEQMAANEAERQKAITAQAIAKAKEEKKKPTPTPEPTPESTPAPTATPKPTAPSEKPALVDQPMKNWPEASDKERMMSAAVLTYTVFQGKTEDTKLLSLAGEELLECLNSVDIEKVGDAPVYSVAALCALKLGWSTK